MCRDEVGTSARISSAAIKIGTRGGAASRSDTWGHVGDFVIDASELPRRSGLAALLMLIATAVCAVPAAAQELPGAPPENMPPANIATGSVSSAVITEISPPLGRANSPAGATTPGSRGATGDGPIDGEGPTRPYWCNNTAALVDDIHKLGGESVMRLELGGGRTLERYWNASEEVIIEHGSDGNSCLVELRQRR